MNIKYGIFHKGLHTCPNDLQYDFDNGYKPIYLESFVDCINAAKEMDFKLEEHFIVKLKIKRKKFSIEKVYWDLEKYMALQ
jgi:hypothetical protein